MAAVLQTGAGETDVSSLASCCTVCFPSKYCERPRADFAFGIVVGLDHLNIGIVRETVLADGREVGRLPARAVQILLNLWRHVELAAGKIEAA